MMTEVLGNKKRSPTPIYLTSNMHIIDSVNMLPKLPLGIVVLSHS